MTASSGGGFHETMHRHACRTTQQSRAGLRTWARVQQDARACCCACAARCWGMPGGLARMDRVAGVRQVPSATARSATTRQGGACEFRHGEPLAVHSTGEAGLGTRRHAPATLMRQASCGSKRAVRGYTAHWRHCRPACRNRPCLLLGALVLHGLHRVQSVQGCRLVLLQLGSGICYPARHALIAASLSGAQIKQHTMQNHFLIYLSKRHPDLPPAQADTSTSRDDFMDSRTADQQELQART